MEKLFKKNVRIYIVSIILYVNLDYTVLLVTKSQKSCF